MIAFLKHPLFGSFCCPMECVKEGNRAKNSRSSHHQSTWDGGQSLNIGSNSEVGGICMNLPVMLLFTLAYLTLVLFLCLWRYESQPIFFLTILFVVLS